MRNRGLESSVRGNDLVFAVHALVMCAVSWSMFWPGVWGWGSGGKGRERERRLSGWVAGVAVGCLGAVGVVVAIVFVRGGRDASVGWAWIDAVSDFFAFSCRFYYRYFVSKVFRAEQYISNNNSQVR